MTRKEAMRQTQLFNTLQSLGFTQQEAEALRRISMTLHRWHELECGIEGGCIERDDKTGRPHWLYSGFGEGSRRSIEPIPDRETGALKRLAKILSARNDRMADRKNTWMISTNGNGFINYGTDKLDAYVQTDPRGAALYILRPGDVPEGCAADSYYSRGICVY